MTVDFATADGPAPDGATAPGDYTSNSGTVTFAAGVTSQTVTVQVNGDTTVEPNETFIVNLSGATGNATITDAQGVGTIQNDDQPVGASNISIDDVSMAEGNSGQTAFNFTVSLSAPQAAPVTVDFATADGPAPDGATAPGDYTSNSGTVTFAAGVTSQTVTVQVNGDTTVEPNETFFVNLSDATGNATITDAQGVGTIQNDDQPVGASNISIDDVSMAEGNSGQTAFNFTVSLSAPQAAPVTVDFATADGPAPDGATAPGDYTSNSGTVTFAAGVTSQTVTVQVNGDATVEPNETFFVNLSGATGNATITDAQGVGTIQNDDQPVGASNISIDDVSMAEGNSGQTAFNFTVSLSAPQAAPVTVDFATADGPAPDGATAPGDYTSNSGTVTFAAGVTSQTVTVQVNGDATVEPNETFFVNLSNATGNATITDAQGVGTIQNDDAAPVGIDAAGDVIVHGQVKATKHHGHHGDHQERSRSKVFLFRVSNLGDSPITVDPNTDIDAVVNVNGTANGSVSSLTGAKTIKPGHSRVFPLRWTPDGTVDVGDTVEFTACVNLAGDVNTANNCDSETRTAR